MCMMVFTLLDISDPARPKKLSDGNVLGTADTPSDIADTYFPEFRSPSLKKLSLGCYTRRGRFLRFFAATITCRTPLAKRLPAQRVVYHNCRG